MFLRSLFLSACCALFVPSVLAADLHSAPLISAPTLDQSRLTWLYEQFLRADSEEEQEAFEESIIAEKQKLRVLIEQELTALLLPRESEDTLDLEKTLDKQRTVVEALQERLSDRKADLTVLTREDALYKERGQATATGVVIEVVTLTKTYPELLARRAVIEERIDVLGQLFAVQQDRLQRIKTEQQLRRSKEIVGVLFYIAVLLGVFWFERAVRTFILTRIPQRRVRYTAMKTFSFVVYTALFFWFAGEIFAEHPNIISAFALVGAATVISAQDIIKGLIGWMTQGRNIDLGDRVMIGTVVGDVIDTGIFHTTLLLTKIGDGTDTSLKDKVVTVPNANLFTQPLVNLSSTSDYVRSEIVVRIAHVSQWKKAKEVLEEILHEVTDEYVTRAQFQMRRRMREYYGSQEFPGSIVFTSLEEEGVSFTLAFPVPIGSKRTATTKITELVLERFTQHTIVLLSEEGDEEHSKHRHHHGETHDGSEDVALDHHNGGGGGLH